MHEFMEVVPVAHSFEKYYVGESLEHEQTTERTRFKREE